MNLEPKVVIPWPQNISVPGVLIFSKVWGSHSHNTALETSDTDYLAVFVSPSRELLGLHPPAESVTHEKPDIQAHEVGKFCRLLLKGNPGIVEMLFTERLYWGGYHWDKLRKLRKEFLTQDTVNAYLGYCHGQLDRLQKGSRLHTSQGEYNTKWAYHLMRLLGDVDRICQGGEPQVWKSGAERDYLMSIRLGEIPMETIVEEAISKIGELKSGSPWGLKKSYDSEMLNDWLLRVRRNR